MAGKDAFLDIDAEALRRLFPALMAAFRASRMRFGTRNNRRNFNAKLCERHPMNLPWC